VIVLPGDRLPDAIPPTRSSQQRNLQVIIAVIIIQILFFADRTEELDGLEADLSDRWSLFDLASIDGYLAPPVAR